MPERTQRAKCFRATPKRLLEARSETIHSPHSPSDFRNRLNNARPVKAILE